MEERKYWGSPDELQTETVGNTGSEMVIREFKIKGYLIPVGFIFDGASAPRVFWSIIPPMYKTKKAACLHDYLCRYATGPIERKEADKLFYEVLRESHEINWIRSTIGYAGVRVGAAVGIGVHYPHWTDKLK